MKLREAREKFKTATRYDRPPVQTVHLVSPYRSGEYTYCGVRNYSSVWDGNGELVFQGLPATSSLEQFEAEEMPCPRCLLVFKDPAPATWPKTKKEEPR